MAKKRRSFCDPLARVLPRSKPDQANIASVYPLESPPVSLARTATLRLFEEKKDGRKQNTCAYKGTHDETK